MIYRLLADVVVLAHLAFVLFAVFGGLFVLRSRRAALVHLPAAAWAVVIELVGWVCPLTPLENSLRQSGGESGYAGSFVEQYVVPILYPGGLTLAVRIGLAGLVVAVNAAIYLYAFSRSNTPHTT